MTLVERLDGLEGIGVNSHGVNRLSWTAEDADCGEWFRAQAEKAGLAVARDPAGNLWACPDTGPPWWGVGSHLDSVRRGGRFDGPLGVACGFEIAQASQLPIAVVAMADEEGARFNTPTFGSKALVGALDLPNILGREDADGISLADAMRAAGVDPERISEATQWLGKLAGFIEIHIDQSTDIAAAGAPLGIVRGLASRRRLEVELIGRADHAGTTPRGERRDALGAAARLIVAADDLGTAFSGMTVTSSRILVAPNASTTIAENVRLWIDARAGEMDTVERWLEQFQARAAEVEARSRVEISVAIASRSVGQVFDDDVRARLQRSSQELLGRATPEVVCFAGHDAGVLAARIPAAMVLVRNPTGVSHSPAESVDLEDAASAARIVQRTLETMS